MDDLACAGHIEGELELMVRADIRHALFLSQILLIVLSKIDILKRIIFQNSTINERRIGYT